MSTVLLVVPPFWDPVCVPLGISSLKRFVETHGHRAHLFDFNTNHEIFGIQREYFEEGKRLFPHWNMWNIERNGTEMLAFHQLVYLNARQHPEYKEFTAEILDLDGCRYEMILSQQLERFDRLFERLYAAVSSQLAWLLETVRPEVIGCSLFNSTWPGALFILREAKRWNPQVRTVLGGPGPLMGISSSTSEVAQFIQGHEYVDYYVLGAGEHALLQILDDRSTQCGIVQSAQGDAHESARTPAPRDERQVPKPNYGQLYIDRYLQLSVASSRGCPFKCSFCAETVFWKGFYNSAADDVADNMMSLAIQYRRTAFYLCDSLSNYIIEPLAAELSRRQLEYSLDCYLRPDRSCCDRSRIRRWRNGGLVRARLGMESGSDQMLKRMAKNNTIHAMEESVKSLADEGVATSTLWIVGHPGETESDFQDTLDFIERSRASIYQADAWVFQYHPSGLAGSATLAELYKSQPRFRPELQKLLSTEPRRLSDIEAGERFARLERFVVRMRELRVPNPYRLFQWVAAESRWKGLGRSTAWSATGDLLSLNE